MTPRRLSRHALPARACFNIYGPEYTDCVLAANTALLAKDPDSVKVLIRAMKAQLLWEQDREAMLEELIGTGNI
jgi:NitT/TauT family transport system substrate-binding protein